MNTQYVYNMGVKKLMDFENSEGIQIRDIVEKYDLDYLEQLNGVYIFVDCSDFLHKACNAMNINTATGKRTSHLKLATDYYKKYHIGYGIELVWVFDPLEFTPLKAKENERRSKNKNRSSVKDIDIDEFEKYLRFLGMATVRCENIEAEHCASILAKHYNGYVLAKDTDVLMYGANLINWSVKAGVTVTRYSRIMEHLGLTDYNEFLRICLMLGCDYADKTYRFGSKSFSKRNNYELSDEQIEAFNYITQNVEICDITKPELDIESAKTLLLDNDFNAEDRIVAGLDI